MPSIQVVHDGKISNVMWLLSPSQPLQPSFSNSTLSLRPHDYLDKREMAGPNTLTAIDKRHAGAENSPNISQFALFRGPA